MPEQSNHTFTCPACGADVPEGALACPECGSDDETGWSEDAEYAHLDLPTGYAHDQTPHRTAKPWSAAWVTVAVVVMILLLVLLGVW